MAKRRDHDDIGAPTLEWVTERYALFVSAVDGHHAARIWQMRPGAAVGCVGEVGREDVALGAPIAGASIERQPGAAAKIGSLPNGRGAGRRIIDKAQIEPVPREAYERNDVRRALDRSIRDGALRVRSAKEYHEQLVATLRLEHAEREKNKAARKSATPATEEKNDDDGAGTAGPGGG